MIDSLATTDEAVVKKNIAYRCIECQCVVAHAMTSSSTCRAAKGARWQWVSSFSGINCGSVQMAKMLSVGAPFRTPQRTTLRIPIFYGARNTLNKFLPKAFPMSIPYKRSHKIVMHTHYEMSVHAFVACITLTLLAHARTYTNTQRNAPRVHKTFWKSLVADENL